MDWLFYIIGPILLLGIMLGFVTYAILFERKVIGWIQNRPGPNQVGPWGVFQTVADIFKLLTKEDIVPERADQTLFKIAPIITFVPAFLVLAVIPFTDRIRFADLAVGLLYYMAISSITTMGILVGSWSGNNKYALLGGMRSAAQMISYEIPLVMSVIGVVMSAHTLNLTKIVAAQNEVWFIFPQLIGFVVFLIASIAELNRTPFDLPEAESELVAGYHVEYTGFRFAFFMLTEYAYIFAMASLTTILFLGGWQAPFGWTFLPPLIWFILKFAVIVFLLFWLRGTLPRLRTDQLMEFAWKVLLPLALFNIFLTAVLKEVPWIQTFYR
ncbi:NADH dehydrogenase subunit H [Seinonella peptonophila]|uniref:NADH-quinone oxidoreductase subunit H n=1 Tax=Seinonella peptonophila TaxID=112248 RepID=A0A1M4XTU1_9BACL|nr:NADH-quinone oxidoreductase subunit NuoH [Seinonella peptonophila]SHE96683.1 NADH dehydrogenase subunit H [Seinonella peptonophila]